MEIDVKDKRWKTAIWYYHHAKSNNIGFIKVKK